MALFKWNVTCNYAYSHFNGGRWSISGTNKVFNVKGRTRLKGKWILPMTDEVTGSICKYDALCILTTLICMKICSCWAKKGPQGWSKVNNPTEGLIIIDSAWKLVDFPTFHY